MKIYAKFVACLVLGISMNANAAMAQKFTTNCHELEIMLEAISKELDRLDKADTDEFGNPDQTVANYRDHLYIARITIERWMVANGCHPL